MAENPQAALVTTLADAGAMLDSFIAWHLVQGFSHLFLFFDDPADPDLPRAAANPRVTAVPYDAALRRAWANLPEYAEHGPFIDSEVQSRQILNVGVAMELARARVGMAASYRCRRIVLFPPARCRPAFSPARPRKIRHRRLFEL